MQGAKVKIIKSSHIQ